MADRWETNGEMVRLLGEPVAHTEAAGFVFVGELIREANAGATLAKAVRDYINDDIMDNRIHMTETLRAYDAATRQGGGQ